MSGWPIWRTAVEPARQAGLGPHWLGICGVLAGLPLFGWVFVFLPAKALGFVFPDAAFPEFITVVGLFIMWTPLVSFMVLLFGVPTAIIAMRRGYGGWLVAVTCGTLFGGITSVLMGFGGTIALTVLSFGIGAAIGGAYWLTARLCIPAAFQTPDHFSHG